MSYTELNGLQENLPALVNFGTKEMTILQDLWHAKVGQLITSIKKSKGEDDEEVSCHILKIWLEEAV